MLLASSESRPKELPNMHSPHNKGRPDTKRSIVPRLRNLELDILGIHTHKHTHTERYKYMEITLWP